MIRFLLSGLLLILAFPLLVVALLVRDPFLYAKTNWPWIALVLTILIICFTIWKRHFVWSTLFVLILLIGIGNEWQYSSQKRRVLAASPEQLWTHGQHLIVGYRDPRMIETLVERKGIAGLFITAANVQGQSPEQFKQWIDKLQAMQKANGLPPLRIACDQEGGLVDRLSPPLPKGPALSTFVTKQGDFDPDKLLQWGQTQASQLQTLGVNMNFSPVVDVPPEDGKSPTNEHLDRFSRISTRSISPRPEIVGEAAYHYSKGLQNGSVLPVAKHFPGLGKVTQDTHLFPADLPTNIKDWHAGDGIPFKLLGAKQDLNIAVMMAHVTFTAVDADKPASISEPVVKLARTILGPNAKLVTDDINMMPTYYRKGGAGKSTAEAIDAGIDWVLIAYRGETYFPIMDYLLKKR